MRKITAITPLAQPKPTKKRVVAYARVSALKDKSLRSLSAQISHYSELIQSRLEWEYAGVYADEALTGTVDSRPEFQRLMEDCRAGKIDIVLVKSISRLARNTVTMLETVRELKNLNIDVWFENESIRSLSTDGELMLSILASFAQEESLSNSENMKWKFKKRFEQGRPSTTIMLGYKLVNEEFIIIPHEAEAVKFIFTEFVKGAKRTEVLKKLRASEHKPKNGGEWQYSSMDEILRNEKYAGVLLLQKHYRENHLTKRKCINRGELPMYRVENNHPAIIDMATFEKAQELLAQSYRPLKKKQKPNTEGGTNKMSAAVKRIVTPIPASVNRYSAVPLANGQKKRVAGYARVSTDTEEQQTSYDAQVDHYTQHIQSNPEWIFMGVYADEGISATSTKKRDGFNRMVADALAGKIDLIITKSVSRFARNTVDTLTTVRKLKEKGVEVYFQKENIYTLDSKGELLITIMSSLAQDESRNISENTTWGKRKQIADGKISLPYAHFLGYEKGEDGLPKIVEAEAKIVRQIYSLYLQGKTHNIIARHLMEQGILSPAGKPKWHISTVMSILQNEKYKGDAMLQKNFTVDYLTKKVKRNEGEVQQFYVENSHKPIIEPETFDLVQAEIKRRRSHGKHHTGLHMFSGKIICGECGGFYGSKVWHSGTKYQRTIWRCNEKYKSKGKCGCQTPHLYEAAIQQVFVQAFNQVYQSKDQLISDYNEIINALTDTTATDHESDALRDECRLVAELLQQCINENARIAQSQTEYQKRYDALHERYDAAKTKLDKLTQTRQEQASKREIIQRFLADLNQQDGLLDEFDEELWYATVESITVQVNGTTAVNFKDGSTINIEK